jgi:NADPH2:quinone reductase
MRAVVISEFGGPEVLKVEEREVPAPGPDQVSIDVAYAGVNFAEVMTRQGGMPGLAAPVVPGLEVSGTVREVGSAVSGLEVGDPVCAFTIFGGYAEVAVASAAATHRLPDGDDATLRRGAALPTVVPTAWALVHEVARLRPDEDVLVSAAAGGVGTLVGQIARRAGAGRVFGIVSTPEKAEYALGFGYDEVFLEATWREQLDAATGARGVDVVFDSVGAAFRKEAFDVLLPMGRLVTFGNASGEPEVSPPGGAIRTQCKAAVGFSISSLTRTDPAKARQYSQEALRVALDDDLRIDITQVLPLADAASAHEALEGRRTTGKTILAVANGSSAN